MTGLVYLRDVVTLELDREECTGCGTCMEVCPHGVFDLDDGLARIVDKDACMECGACATNCPEGALSVRSGVGCASAVINAVLGRESACCVIESDSGNGKKPANTGCCG